MSVTERQTKTPSHAPAVSSSGSTQGGALTARGVPAARQGQLGYNCGHRMTGIQPNAWSRTAPEAAVANPEAGRYDVAVSIVSMGDTAALAKCLTALRSAASGLATACTVIDNSREPGAVEATASAYGASVVRVEGRRGFGTNQNAVLRQLVATGAPPYVLVLNDDVLLDARALVTLVGHMEANPLAGAAAPQLLQVDGSLAPTKLDFPSLASEVMRWFAQRQMSDLCRPGWLVGACMMLRVSALAVAGVFDERFFLFYEDVDMCLRITRAGFRCDLVSEATAVHIGHQSVGPITVGSLSSREYRRSRWRYFIKHGQPLAAVLLTAASWFVVPLRRLSSAARAERAAQHRAKRLDA